MAIYDQRPISSYTVKDLFVFKYLTSGPGYDIKSRKCSSVLHFLKGNFKYEFDDKEFILSRGDSLYLPKGATYKYSVIEDDSEVIQASFDLFCNDEPCVFSNKPLPFFCDKENYAEIFLRLINNSTDDISAITELFGFLEIVKNSVDGDKNPSYSKLRPAAQYLRKHYTEKIPISYLSSLCELSESHFRLLFSKEFGISPIKYKNRLVCQAAVKLIEGENMSISQVSDTLGFSDIYTFSQMFKKEMGISPSKYLKQRS